MGSGVPPDFLCPISLEIMIDPVTLETGHTYDRSSIDRWFALGKFTCPVTMQPLSDLSLTPNTILKHFIAEWIAASSPSLPSSSLEFRRTTAALPDALFQLLLADHPSPQQRVFAGMALLAHLRATPMLLENYIHKDGAPDKFFSSLCFLLKRTTDLKSIMTGLHLLKALFLSERCKNMVEKHIGSFVSILLQSVLPECSRNGMIEASELALEILNMVSVKCCYEANEEDAYGDFGQDCDIIERGKEALFNSPSAVPSLSEVIMRVSEKCTIYAVLILLEMAKKLVKNVDSMGVESDHHPLLLLVSRPNSNNIDANTSSSTSSHISSLNSTSFFMSSGLPRKLLLVLQSNCSPFLKKRCAELLKILDSARRQGKDAKRKLYAKRGRPPSPAASSSCCCPSFWALSSCLCYGFPTDKG